MAEPNLNELDESILGGRLPDDNEYFSQRQPFVYDPRTDTVHLGPQGSHHGHIIPALGLPWTAPGQMEGMMNHDPQRSNNEFMEWYTHIGTVVPRNRERVEALLRRRFPEVASRFDVANQATEGGDENDSWNFAHNIHARMKLSEDANITSTAILTGKPHPAYPRWQPGQPAKAVKTNGEWYYWPIGISAKYAEPGALWDEGSPHHYHALRALWRIKHGPADPQGYAYEDEFPEEAFDYIEPSGHGSRFNQDQSGSAWHFGAAGCPRCHGLSWSLVHYNGGKQMGYYCPDCGFKTPPVDISDVPKPDAFKHPDNLWDNEPGSLVVPSTWPRAAAERESRTGDVLPGEWPWRPGSWGKAIAYKDGPVYHWAVSDNDGLPSHEEAHERVYPGAEQHGWNEARALYEPLIIAPTGEIRSHNIGFNEYEDMNGPERAAQAIPGTHAAPRDEYDSYFDDAPDVWDFESRVGNVPAWESHGVRGKFPTHGNSSPWVYDHYNRVLHTGEGSSYHLDMEDLPSDIAANWLSGKYVGGRFTPNKYSYYHLAPQLSRDQRIRSEIEQAFAHHLNLSEEPKSESFFGKAANLEDCKRVIKLKDGTEIVEPFPASVSHLDMLRRRGLTPNDVEDFGIFLPNGQYESMGTGWYRDKWNFSKVAWNPFRRQVQQPQGPDLFEQKMPIRSQDDFSIHRGFVRHDGSVFGWQTSRNLPGVSEIMHNHYHKLNGTTDADFATRWRQYPNQPLEVDSKDPEHIRAVQSYLYGKGILPNDRGTDNGWNFAKMASPWSVEEVKDNGTFMRDDTDFHWRRPVIFHPKERKAWIGPEGSYHSDVLNVVYGHPYNPSGTGYGWIGTDPEHEAYGFKAHGNGLANDDQERESLRQALGEVEPAALADDHTRNEDEWGFITGKTADLSGLPRGWKWVKHNGQVYCEPTSGNLYNRGDDYTMHTTIRRNNNLPSQAGEAEGMGIMTDDGQVEFYHHGDDDETVEQLKQWHPNAHAVEGYDQGWKFAKIAGWDFDDMSGMPHKFVWDEHQQQGAIAQPNEHTYHDMLAFEHGIDFTHAGVLRSDHKYELYLADPTPGLEAWLKTHDPEAHYTEGYEEGYKVAKTQNPRTDNSTQAQGGKTAALPYGKGMIMGKMYMGELQNPRVEHWLVDNEGGPHHINEEGKRQRYPLERSLMDFVTTPNGVQVIRSEPVLGQENYRKCMDLLGEHFGQQPTAMDEGKYDPWGPTRWGNSIQAPGKTAAIPDYMHFHVAPTADRERIRAHGLMPAQPGVRQQMDAPQGDVEGLRGYQQPGVYMFKHPSGTQWLGNSPNHDVWAVDTRGLQLHNDKDELMHGQFGAVYHPNPVEPQRLRLLPNSPQGQQQWDWGKDPTRDWQEYQQAQGVPANQREYHPEWAQKWAQTKGIKWDKYFSNTQPPQPPQNTVQVPSLRNSSRACKDQLLPYEELRQYLASAWHPVLQLTDGTELHGEPDQHHLDLLDKHGKSWLDVQRLGYGDGKQVDWAEHYGKRETRPSLKEFLTSSGIRESIPDTATISTDRLAEFNPDRPWENPGRVLKLNDGRVVEWPHGDGSVGHLQKLQEMGLDPSHVREYGYRYQNGEYHPIQGAEEDYGSMWNHFFNSKSIDSAGGISTDHLAKIGLHEPNCPYGYCGEYAETLQRMYPDLKTGYHYLSREENPENESRVGHIFLHDDTHAYDAYGKHPLPYEYPWGDGEAWQTILNAESPYAAAQRGGWDLDEIDYSDWIRWHGDPRSPGVPRKQSAGEPDETGDWFHVAPTADRARIRTHGLQPAWPGANERWWEPIYDHATGEEGPSAPPYWAQRQPDGVYVEPTPEQAYERWGTDPSTAKTEPGKWDIWRIPASQVRDTVEDHVTKGVVIPHVVYPELHQGPEHRLPKIAGWDGYRKALEAGWTPGLRPVPVSQVGGIEQQMNVRPWEPGVFGKGVVVDGQAFGWRSDHPEDAHHDDVLDHFDKHPPEGVSPDWQHNGYFMIHPDGGIMDYSVGMEGEWPVEQIARAAGRPVKNLTDEARWEFDGAAEGLHKSIGTDLDGEPIERFGSESQGSPEWQPPLPVGSEYIPRPYESWTEGNDGKAIWDRNTNRLWAWNTDVSGWPHHFDLQWTLTGRDKGIRVPAGWEHFYIGPSGILGNFRGSHPEDLAAVEPRFKAEKKKDWQFFGDTANWILHEGQGASLIPGEHPQRRPFMYDPQGREVWVGDVGWMHNDIAKQMNVYWPGKKQGFLHPTMGITPSFNTPPIPEDLKQLLGERYPEYNFENPDANYFDEWHFGSQDSRGAALHPLYSQGWQLPKAVDHSGSEVPVTPYVENDRFGRALLMDDGTKYLWGYPKNPNNEVHHSMVRNAHGGNSLAEWWIESNELSRFTGTAGLLMGPQEELVNQAHAELPGSKVQNTDTDDWKFGAREPNPEPLQLVNGFDYKGLKGQPWEPGKAGKGLVIGNQVLVWGNGKGVQGLHHVDFPEGMMVPAFYIMEDGRINTNFRKGSEWDTPELWNQVAALHPNLRPPEPEPEWKFGAVEGPDRYTIVELPKAPTGYPHAEHPKRRPLVVHNDRIYVGNPGWMHADLNYYTPHTVPLDVGGAYLHPTEGVYGVSDPDAEVALRAYFPEYDFEPDKDADYFDEWHFGSSLIQVDEYNLPVTPTAERWQNNRRPIVYYPHTKHLLIGAEGDHHYNPRSFFETPEDKAGRSHSGYYLPKSNRWTWFYEPPDRFPEVRDALAERGWEPYDPPKTDWHFGSGIPEIIEGRMPAEDSYFNAEGGGWGPSHANQRPVVYVPGQQKIYIGQPGTHHADVVDEFGLAPEGQSANWQDDYTSDMIGFDPDSHLDRELSYGLWDLATNGLVTWGQGIISSPEARQALHQIGVKDIPGGHEDWHFGGSADDLEDQAELDYVRNNPWQPGSRGKALLDPSSGEAIHWTLRPGETFWDAGPHHAAIARAVSGNPHEDVYGWHPVWIAPDGATRMAEYTQELPGIYPMNRLNDLVGKIPGARLDKGEGWHFGSRDWKVVEVQAHPDVMADPFMKGRRPWVADPDIRTIYWGPSGYFHHDLDIPIEREPDNSGWTQHYPDKPVGIGSYANNKEYEDAMRNHVSPEMKPAKQTEEGTWTFEGNTGQVENDWHFGAREPQIRYMPDDAMRKIYKDDFVHDAYQGRRAFVYSPSQHTVYMGSPGAHHDHVENYFKLPWERDRSFGVYQEQPSTGFGSSDQIGVRTVGLPRQEHRPIFEWVANKHQVPLIEDENTWWKPEWDFESKLADIQGQAELGHSIGWNPGTWGKGILFRDGSVHTWPTTGVPEKGIQEGDGKPWHDEYIRNQFGNNLPVKTEQYFAIQPDGKATYSPHYDEFIRDADPRLQAGGSRWDFESKAIGSEPSPLEEKVDKLSELIAAIAQTPDKPARRKLIVRRDSEGRIASIEEDE